MVAVVNQIPFSGQYSLLRVREIPGNLAHPQSVRRRRDARDLHLPRRQVDEEQNDKTLQSSPRPHFHGEEICSYNQLPMPAQTLLPCRLSPPLGCGLDPVSFQNRSDRTASKLVAQIGQCTPRFVDIPNPGFLLTCEPPKPRSR